MVLVAKKIAKDNFDNLCYSPGPATELGLKSVLYKKDEPVANGIAGISKNGIAGIPKKWDCRYLKKEG